MDKLVAGGGNMTPNERAQNLFKVRRDCTCGGIDIGIGQMHELGCALPSIEDIAAIITEAVEEERRACIGIVRNFSPTENQRKAFVIGAVRGVFGSMQNAFADAIEARGKKP